MNNLHKQSTEIKKISRRDVLDYEVRSHSFIKHVKNKYLQNILGWWMARKVRIKYNRYLISLDELNDLKERDIIK